MHPFAGDLPFKLDTMLMMDDVANFQMLTLAGCGIAFELPVVLSIVGWMGIVSSRGLLKFNKYAIVLAFVVCRGADPQHGSIHADPARGTHVRALQHFDPGGLDDRACPAQARRGSGQRQLEHRTGEVRDLSDSQPQDPPVL